MAINTKEFLSSFLEHLSRIDYIRPEDLPNIDLYMDQVTTFMDSQLAGTKRFEDDKILTKTMINNYAKNNLLPPPDKKKYSKEHILTLIFIYYFKNILSISDIQRILNPITDRYFGSDADMSLEDIYREVFSLEHTEVQNLLKDVGRKFRQSQDTFQDVKDDDAQEFLRTFSMICLLSFDVYIKKMLIEKIIDQLPAQDTKSAREKHKKKEKAADS